MKHILLADDEEEYRHLFMSLLEPLGIQLTWVPDGLEAIQLIRARPFDLVFLDMHMPRLEGAETLKEIMKLRPDQKVVMLSSFSDPVADLKEGMKKKGALECLYKPVDIDDIYRVLGNIEKSGPEDSLHGSE